MLKRLLILMAFVLPMGLSAQEAVAPDGLRLYPEAVCDSVAPGVAESPLLATSLLGTAFVAAGTSPFYCSYSWKANKIVREEVQLWRRNSMGNRYIAIDNVMQYVPVATVLVLGAAGVESRHDMVYIVRSTAVTYAVLAACVLPLKYGSGHRRPDHSGYTSFPSGHTAISFAGAEMLRVEYSATSPWIPVAGYGVAVLTGFMRIYNDKHWAGDVLAGAGIGILSADLSYWLNGMLFGRDRESRQCAETINRPLLWNLY